MSVPLRRATMKYSSRMGSFVVGVLVAIILIVIVSYKGIPSIFRSDTAYPGTPPKELVVPITNYTE